MPSAVENVMVPKQISETRRPVGPSVWYFIGDLFGVGDSNHLLDVAMRSPDAKTECLPQVRNLGPLASPASTGRPGRRSPRAAVLPRCRLRSPRPCKSLP